MGCEINFPARFVLDEFFIKDILKDKVNASKILMKLICLKCFCYCF